MVTISLRELKSAANPIPCISTLLFSRTLKLSNQSDGLIVHRRRCTAIGLHFRWVPEVVLRETWRRRNYCLRFKRWREKAYLKVQRLLVKRSRSSNGSAVRSSRKSLNWSGLNESDRSGSLYLAIWPTMTSIFPKHLTCFFFCAGT
jgi:hypothetical protein